MSPSRVKRLAATALSFFAFAAGAWAAPITIGFSGTLTSSFGSLNSGDAFSGSYTFDPSIAGTGTSSFAVFNNLVSASLTIGAFSATIGPGTGLPEIQQDDVPGADRYALVGRNAVGSAPIGGLNIFVFGFRLDDPSGTAVSNALMLLTNPSLGSFATNTFTMFFGSFANLQVVSGTLTSLAPRTVPEPGTLALFAAAILLALAVARRRATRVA